MPLLSAGASDGVRVGEWEGGGENKSQETVTLPPDLQPGVALPRWGESLLRRGVGYSAHARR